MAFCKVCDCGKKIVFESKLGFPENCPYCGRKLVKFITYNEDDPIVEELMKTDSSSEDLDKVASADVCSVKYLVTLKICDGKEIRIPEQGCIVGRTEVGAEELADYPSVSRQHLKVIIRRNLGVFIEDISRYGTLVDGNRIEKYRPIKVSDGATITLCNLEVLLSVKELSD